MDLGKLPLFSMMSQRLTWLGKRQQVLAQNIANADTPNFKAHDLKEPSFRELVTGKAAPKVHMVATRRGHILPPNATAMDFKETENKEGDVALNGNSVDIEDQMTRVAQTAMDHQVTVNLYRKHIAMIKAALGRPGG